MSWANENKSTSPTYQNTLRKGRETILSDIENLTFEDPIFSDGTLVKDATFDQFAAQVWTNENKNSTTFTNGNTRN